MTRNATCIAFSNQKGGVGKTTTTVNLAGALAARGFDVCVVDCDEQTNATKALGVNADKHADEDTNFTVVDAYVSKRPLSKIAISFEPEEGSNAAEAEIRTRLHLAPSHRGLGSVETHIESALQTERVEKGLSPLEVDERRFSTRTRLKTSIDSAREKYDFILIDTPPKLDFLLLSALVAADYYIIPASASLFDLQGLSRLSATVKDVRENYNPTLRLLGVLLGDVNLNANLDKQIYERLAQQFGEEKLFNTKITTSRKHREAVFYGKTIVEHEPSHAGAEQFLALADEVLERLAAEKPEETVAAAEVSAGAVSNG